MAALDELRAEIAASNTKAAENGVLLTEIASDIDDLIAKLANGEPGSAEVAEATAEAKALTAKLTETGERMQSTAGKHTP